jgi:hypothetical protein
MPRYRCYVLGEQDHILDVLEIETRALVTAVANGLRLLSAHPDLSIEIWKGEETLYRSPPTGTGAPNF